MSGVHKNPTISFRISDYEKREIEARIKASGMMKKTFFTRCCIYGRICVVGKKEGLCWFPRLMRWKTSKGEVAPVFLEKSDGYSYSLYGYMNVDTKEYYYKESVQWEITAGNRTGKLNL